MMTSHGLAANSRMGAGRPSSPSFCAVGDVVGWGKGCGSSGVAMVTRSSYSRAFCDAAQYTDREKLVETRKMPHPECGYFRAEVPFDLSDPNARNKRLEAIQNKIVYFAISIF